MKAMLLAVAIGLALWFVGFERVRGVVTGLVLVVGLCAAGVTLLRGYFARRRLVKTDALERAAMAARAGAIVLIGERQDAETDTSTTQIT